MSDTWIIVIPELPDLVPADDAQARAVELFRELAPKADEVKKQVSDVIRFIDCGVNLNRVTCPHCNEVLDIEWWQDLMYEESKAGFPLREIELPCCRASARPDQLAYDWPQGFARFSVEAMNPGIPDLSQKQLAHFESVLGCRVRKILQHL